MCPYIFIHLNKGRKRAPPRSSDTSSSLAVAMGIPESSRPMVIDRLREVSQSGLTQELVLVGLGLLSNEHVTERKGSEGLEGTVMGLKVKVGDERSEKEERDIKLDMFAMIDGSTSGE